MRRVTVGPRRNLAACRYEGVEGRLDLRLGAFAELGEVAVLRERAQVGQRERAQVGDPKGVLVLGEVADRAGGELQGGEQLGDALEPLDGGEHIVDVAGCLADRSGCAADLGAAQRDVAPRQEVAEGGDGHVEVRRQARAQHVEVKLAALLRRVDDLRDDGVRRRELDRASLGCLAR